MAKKKPGIGCGRRTKRRIHFTPVVPEEVGKRAAKALTEEWPLCGKRCAPAFMLTMVNLPRVEA